MISSTIYKAFFFCVNCRQSLADYHRQRHDTWMFPHTYLNISHRSSKYNCQWVRLYSLLLLASAKHQHTFSLRCKSKLYSWLWISLSRILGNWHCDSAVKNTTSSATAVDNTKSSRRLFQLNKTFQCHSTHMGTKGSQKSKHLQHFID